MIIVYNIMVFLHIVGAAMIVGIWIGNMKKPTVHPRQFDGAALQIITGIVMMGLSPALVMDANYFKLGIKFAIALAVGVLAFMGRRKYKKGEDISAGLAHSVGGLALLNVAIATLWN
jgi:FtsH-binding integral membrane protein